MMYVNSPPPPPQPVFKPRVMKGLEDTGQIDPVFTREKAEDSLVESRLGDTQRRENKFDGFTYTADSALVRVLFAAATAFVSLSLSFWLSCG